MLYLTVSEQLVPLFTAEWLALAEVFGVVGFDPELAL